MDVLIKEATIEELLNYEKELIELMNYSIKINRQCNTNDGTLKYQKLLDYFRKGMTCVSLAFVNKRIVGYVQFFEAEYGRIHLNEIVVSEKYQKLGIGHLLMRVVEDYALSLDIEYIELFCSESNDNAKKFYNKHNYLTEKRLMIKSVKG